MLSRSGDYEAALAIGACQGSRCIQCLLPLSAATAGLDLVQELLRVIEPGVRQDTRAHQYSDQGQCKKEA